MKIITNNFTITLQPWPVVDQTADVLVVPQRSTGVSLKGTSATLIHSRSQSGIRLYLDYLKKHKILPLGNVFFAQCHGHYRYLAHIAVLDSPQDKVSNYIETAILKTVQKADELGLQSIVIPEIKDMTRKELQTAFRTFLLSVQVQNVKEITFILSEENINWLRRDLPPSSHSSLWIN